MTGSSMEAIAKSAGYCAASNWRDYGKPMLTGVGAKVVGTAFALGANKMSAL
jgi:hypothetical protein